MVERVRRRGRELPGPHEDAEVQEALSRVHSSDRRTVLRLRSRRYALFSPSHELLYVDSWSELEELF